MAEHSSGVHERLEALKAETVDRHRAIVSIMEELEAVDWDASALGLGRTEPVDSVPEEGVQVRLRKVQPLVEMRVPFVLQREELEAPGRGAQSVVSLL